MRSYVAEERHLPQLQSPFAPLQYCIDARVAHLPTGVRSLMFSETTPTPENAVTRRGFLKRVALLGAAASALGILSRGPLGSLGERRSTPAGLPGEGSIFQPRNDTRIQR